MQAAQPSTPFSSPFPQESVGEQKYHVMIQLLEIRNLYKVQQPPLNSLSLQGPQERHHCQNDPYNRVSLLAGHQQGSEGYLNCS